MKKVLFFILFAFLPILASAEVVEIDGIYYNVVAKAKMAEVTENPEVYYSGKVVIPKSVVYKGVIRNRP